MKRLACNLLALTLLTGCFDSDSSKPDTTPIGQLTSTGIEGLDYRTASQSARTGSEGRFRYFTGETVSFRLGELVLAEDVPTGAVLTPLDFLPEMRSMLMLPVADAEGLLSHQPVEEALIDDAALINKTRLLMVLNRELGTNTGRGVILTDRVLSQFAEHYAERTEDLDFTTPVNQFAQRENAEQGLEDSQATRIVRSICFFPASDSRCDTPPTQEEIDLAPVPPENNADRDPDIVYRDDLERRRNQIVGARRTMESVSVDDVKRLLRRELELATVGLAKQYYLSQTTARLDHRDTGIKRLTLRKVAGTPVIDGIEAMSTNENAVMIHSFNAETASVEYFLTGSAGEEATLVISFRPTGEYRWVRKSLRVILD
ncbi:MAG: organic solvent ABC transporter permease [Marinobacter sp.]|nr:organic solvent ABC transporter permease [Marinobacter sp.]